MKTYLKIIGMYTLFLVLITFISSILNIYGVSKSITNVVLFIFNLISFIIFGYINGVKANKNGYIAGLKVSSLFIIELIIINLITVKSIFKISTILYYSILLLSGILAGMFGINKKKND